MRILVLGGTEFVGRAYVEEALGAGHDVTLFNRGQTAPELFPGIAKLRGDRDIDLSVLGGGEWDAVFDPSCYLPRHARMAADILGDVVAHYTLVSSLSVYADETTPDQDESGPLATMEDPTIEDPDAFYGPLKALSEREIERGFGDRALIVRPGFICGPYDNADRMPYWLRRLGRGGEVLAPDSPEFPVQLIDARDIARFALTMAERSQGGVFNLCAPPDGHRMEYLLETAAHVVGATDFTLTWAPGKFLVEQGLGRWEALPWWVAPRYAAITRFDASKAHSAGLVVRPIAESFRDCWAWDLTRGDAPLPPDVGLAPEREAELLATLRARGQTTNA